MYDVGLIGAGPCGIAAAVDFKKAGLDVVQLEEGAVAQTIANFPSGMRLYSSRKVLEIEGVAFSPSPDESPNREEYLVYLNEVARRYALGIRSRMKAVKAVPNGRAYVLASRTDGVTKHHHVRNIVVANGGYVTPVLLGIPGEDSRNVFHFFRSDLSVEGQRILVVGGRNSAVEAAITLSDRNAEVILSYRGSRLPRKKIKPWLMPNLDAAKKSGRIRVLYRSNPLKFEGRSVVLSQGDGRSVIRNVDKVFLLTGYGPKYDFLSKSGVPFHTRTRKPLFNSRTLETRLPGIFLCGTIVLRWLGEKASIENTRSHGKIILENLRI